MKRNNLITRFFLLSMLLALTGFSAFAQKDILLYSTDFTDWGAIDGSGASSDDVFTGTGAGAGFSVGGKPTVNPTGTIGGYTGYFVGGNSGTTMTIKPLEYVSGGVVEVWFYINGEGSTRTITLDKPVTQVMMEDLNMTGTVDYRNVMAGGTNMAINDGATGADRGTVDSAKLGVWHAGADAKIRYTGFVKVSFHIPSLSGVQTVKLDGMNNGKIHMVALKVYTSPGTLPYVASTNYGKAPAPGHAMQGAVGGAANSGTVVNDLVNVKGWNIGTSDVTLRIEGGKFSFSGANPDGTLTIPNANALAGFDVPINFTPSVREGVAEAVLVISAPGCADYRVSLKGITGDGSTAPKILANENRIPFYTSVVEKKTLPFSFAGVNLTGPVNITFEGTVASRFSVSETSVSAANAMAGHSIDITFTGTLSPSEYEDMFLVLKSAGAADVRVPLSAITREVRPTFGEINFSVNPAGTAFLDLSLVGPKYEVGTAVTVNVLAETGYTIASWSDNRGSKNPNRTFYVGLGTRNIVVDMREIAGPPPVDTSSSFVAYTPATTTDDGFLASWTNAEGANPGDYTVRVYDKKGNEVTATPITTVNAGASNSVNITGLKPATPVTEDDFFFYYEVTTTTDPTPDNPLGEEMTTRVGPIKLQGIIPFACGQ